ncbi:hypothetical protein CQ018_03410 [Arthrobacter sp. MYb227]|uniref:septum formation family protein n=1 Tax=Arthrobacter sp. MYb227 TaxID=1848601 RepID=UPI000CFC2FD6|nr:septum formation family protein [Arthrobacter sp. MYb227]PQZ96325.1 hypothetical protein CQ018_03410 [Arthrobacter sp. MYb227]
MPVPPFPEGKAALPPRSAQSQKRAWWQATTLWALIGAMGVLLIVLYGADKFFGANQAQDPTPNVSRNPNPGIDGVIALDVPPEQLETGDCLQGFATALAPVTVVTCATSHNAQMIGSFEVTETQFPGADALMRRSEDLCKAIVLDPKSGIDASWSYHFSRPSEKTWKTGDRTVACFLALNEGTVQNSLLPSDALGITS